MSFLPPTLRKQRCQIAGATAIAGFLTMIAISQAFGEVDPSMSAMLVSATLGAGLSGLLFAPLFGHARSWKDGLLAAGASILATGLGSFLGGMIWALIGIFVFVPASATGHNFLDAVGLMPQAGGFAFAIVMFVSPAEFPYLVAVWAALMLGVQVAAFLARQRTAA